MLDIHQFVLLVLLLFKIIPPSQGRAHKEWQSHQLFLCRMETIITQKSSRGVVDPSVIWNFALVTIFDCFVVARRRPSAPFNVVILSFVFQEYTEEIERLRRDLLAAREKNGVYMAQENYEQITREIELQRKEIVEKLEQIKAMEEEQARKEEACQQLQSLYDEQQTVLQVNYPSLLNSFVFV